MFSPVWIISGVILLALVAIAIALKVMRRSSDAKSQTEALPEEWPLVQRAIFSPEERALYRQLRAALPNHMVLAKLPLVRFCQPQDREELRYWFGLLGPIHVSFVVCADNGRVLAAIDLEKPNRPSSKRTLAIKQAVLESCRVRYVKCRTDQLPSAAELQMLVPHQTDGARPQVPSTLADRQERRSTLAHSLRANDNQTQWFESGFSHDSFFAPETQRDPLADEPVSSKPGAPQAQTAEAGAEADPAQRIPRPIRRREDFGPSGDSAGHIIGRG